MLGGADQCRALMKVSCVESLLLLSGGSIGPVSQLHLFCGLHNQNTIFCDPTEMPFCDPTKVPFFDPTKINF